MPHANPVGWVAENTLNTATNTAMVELAAQSEVIHTPTEQGLRDYLYRHNHNLVRESQWVPLILKGYIRKPVKTVVVSEDGVETITDDAALPFTLSTVLDLTQPRQKIDVAAWQKRIKSENPILNNRRGKAIASAWKSRGRPFSWEPSNTYHCSMMRKVPQYFEYCLTGREPELTRAVRGPHNKQKKTPCATSNKRLKLAGTDEALQTAVVPWTKNLDEVCNGAVACGEGDDTPTPSCRCHRVAGADPRYAVRGVDHEAMSNSGGCLSVAQSDGADRHLPKNTEQPVDLKRPNVPDIDVQEGRILFRNSALVKHLRAHKRGDWVKNPHRCVAGKHTTEKTKDRAADTIKSIVREWLLTTPQGKRALNAADIGEGELSIDRIFARHDKNGMGLNCIYNLYMMPVRHNSYFGDKLSAEKCAYVGKRAFSLAKGAHDAFVRDTEAGYDWDAGFAKRADFIVNAHSE
jgi:hypothetical protein